MSQPGDYTIGWICAIQTEYVAAREFLDEEHKGPSTVSSNDNNAYTLGKMGGHNVVIAVLPNGQYGISSATAVVKDMVHTFKNIRIGLMVGIGGGAPSEKHDIRLGDVVVSAPREGRGGVFQYDFGKTIQDQSFKAMGVLNQPPSVLLTAITVISGQYESDGHNLENDINDVLRKKPRLKKKYGRPNPESDKLYMSGVIHSENNEASCEAVCDPTMLVVRAERAEDEDNLAVHYGLIASGNQLMKDGLVRDKLAAEEGILCFEMEAAGLMNHFPCLVIRGICDYSDSHKNKDWQGYAAMAAAAYSKDILRRIAPSRVEAETRLSDILSGLYRVATEQLEISREHIQAQKDLAQKVLTQEERECHQQFRLTASDKNITYEWYKNRVEERVEDTCLWFLQHHHFQAWLEQKSGPLLVTADPGCGKSVLAKYLIDYSLPRSVTICYFFFKDQDQDTVRQALCALLHQLFNQKPSLIKHAIPQYRKDGSGLINTTESLWNILRNAIKDPQMGSIILVLDALDECAESNFKDLVRNIEIQCRSKDKGYSKLKYLLTCRPYNQIISGFRNLLNAFPNIHIPGEEESEMISREVSRVITFRVSQLSDNMNLSSQVKTHLEQRLQKTANRTYLWVYLVFEKLRTNDFKKTHRGIESAIQTLPSSVNEAYEQILKKSNNEEYQMVRKVLSIILASRQSLSLLELNIATNIDNTTKSLHDLDLEDENDFKKRIRSWCGLFISIYQGHVYFLHQTAREFLLANSPSSSSSSTGLSSLQWYRSIALQDAQAILAKLCIHYLDLFNSDTSVVVNVNEEVDNHIDQLSFLHYSARNWGAHFLQADFMDGAAIIPLALRIFDPGSKSFLVWFEIYWGCTAYVKTSGFTDLMLASYYGHDNITKLLLGKGASLESKDTHYSRPPLMWAIQNGQTATAKLLIEKGAKLELKDRGGLTPLALAAKKGHEAIVKLLIENGAKLEPKDSGNLIPLAFAAKEGHEAIVKLLLENGANVEPKGCHSRTPLILAVQQGHKAIISLLIENGANVEPKGSHGQVPLILAVQNKDIAIAKLLIENGADLESRDKYGQTPLILAAQHGHKAIISLLIEKGANLESKSKLGWTPLVDAARHGKEAVVKLLIEKGADVESKDERGQTILTLSVRMGYVDIFQLLLETSDADANSRDNCGRTPLWWAAQSGEDAMLVALISSERVDIDVKDYYGSTPLSIAARHDKIEITKRLLDTKRVDWNSQDHFGRSPLWYARRHGSLDIAQLLLEYAEKTDKTFCDHGLQMHSEEVPRPIRGFISRRLCDVCTLGIPESHGYHNCATCHVGDFHVCLDCHELGARCIGMDHELICLEADHAPIRELQDSLQSEDGSS